MYCEFGARGCRCNTHTLINEAHPQTETCTDLQLVLKQITIICFLLWRPAVSSFIGVMNLITLSFLPLICCYSAHYSLFICISKLPWLPGSAAPQVTELFSVDSSVTARDKIFVLFQFKFFYLKKVPTSPPQNLPCKINMSILWNVTCCRFFCREWMRCC